MALPVETVSLFVLEEFRLRSGLEEAETAELVAASSGGSDCDVPLLTSLADPRDCAILHAEGRIGGAQAESQRRIALVPLVATWHPRRRFHPRIAERSSERVGYYRMAVTELGSQGDGQRGTTGERRANSVDPPVASRAALLWIGEPVDSRTGLLVLVGYRGQPEVVSTRGCAPWPLPLGNLGVRIYESAPG